MSEHDTLIPGHGLITHEARRPLRVPVCAGDWPPRVWATELCPALRVWLDGRAPANDPCLQPVDGRSVVTIPNSASAVGKGRVLLIPIDEGDNHA